MEFVAQHPVLVVSLVKIVVLIFVLMTALAYLTWFERKVVARIQARIGPLYVGAHGLLQPLADGVKFLFKEDVTPPASDRFVYVLAPFLALSLAMATIALIPFGPATIMILGVPTHLAIANVSLGLLFLFAITSMGVYGVALAGWSSNSKYPLLGGLRSSAQMVSYEVSLTLSVVGVVLLSGTLNFNRADHEPKRPLVPRRSATGTSFRNSSASSAISSLPSPKRIAFPSICLKPRPNSSPDFTPNIPASNSPCSSWPNTRT